MTSKAIGIGRLDERILVQRNVVTFDRYRNRIAAWDDYFSCYARVETFAKSESGTPVIHDGKSVTFVVRYCPELDGIISTEYRVVFKGEEYNIKSVDLMNYGRHVIKLVCEKEVRGNVG